MDLARLLELPRSSFYVTCNGRIVSDWSTLQPTDVFHVHLRLPGGKGGFGSLLRSFRIHRSTNQLMCRDLSGRRLHDVKEEERLKKWLEKTAEREADKEKKRKEKYEKLKKGAPKHDFEDQDYIQQREAILDRTDEAFEQGLKALQGKKDEPAGGGIGEKRKLDEETGGTGPDKAPTSPPAMKKPKLAQDEQKTVTVVSEKDPVPVKLTKQQKKERYEAEKRRMELEAASRDETRSVDLATIDSVDQLHALGLLVLKRELEMRGLKCGGSLEERAARLFSVKGLAPEEYPKAALAAAGKKP